MSTNKILVISVHPDDETLGCGGTLLKHAGIGDSIYWLILTRMDVSLGYSSDQIQIAKAQIDRVAHAYHFADVFELGFPTTKLQIIDFSLLVQKISGIVGQLKPRLIYMNNRSDIHTDHQVASKAIFSATKVFRHPYVKRVLMYECLSETEVTPQFAENVFLPTVFSDITIYLDKKLEIMSLYQTELQGQTFPRSLEIIKSLAAYRGSSACCAYAEAFMHVREIF